MFNSILANEMINYLKLREISVSKYTFQDDQKNLLSFDRYLQTCGFDQKELTEEVISEWTCTLSGKSQTVSAKVGVIRGFVKYLNSLGIHSFTPDHPKVKSNFIPYIYTDDEVELIMHYADNLESRNPKNSSPYLSLMIPMFIRILYGCGTRVGETVALKRKDIDFKMGTLFLRETKFSKERVIPVHETLLEILQRYCCALGIMDNPEAYLFPGKKAGQHYSKRAMCAWFTEILKFADIDQRNRDRYERGACLHSFRHLFVLKSMQQLEKAGRSVDMNDLLLPTYLGHKCLVDTDKYMRFSGVRVPEAIDAFENFTNGLIPQVEVPYEEE